MPVGRAYRRRRGFDRRRLRCGSMRCSISRTRGQVFVSLRRSVDAELRSSGRWRPRARNRGCSCVASRSVAAGPCSAPDRRSPNSRSKTSLGLISLGMRRRSAAPGDVRLSRRSCSRESQLPACGRRSQPSSSDGKRVGRRALRGELVDGDAGPDVGAVGLARLAAGEEAAMARA